MVSVIVSLLAQWIGASWFPESICHGFWVMEVSFSKSHESNITRSEISCSSSHESYRCVLNQCPLSASYFRSNPLSVAFVVAPIIELLRFHFYWCRCRLTNYRRKWAKFWKRTTKIQEYIRKLYLIKAARFLSIFTTDSWSEMVSSVVLLVRRIRQNLGPTTQNLPEK